MELILANPRGFCAGVKRAISIVSKALELHGRPVYVLHEIVHNTHVIHELRGKGAVFVECLEDIPSGSVTIFSAHGVSQAVVEHAHALGLRTIDATCPLVAQVHRRVIRLNQLGHDVLVIGHKGHPEVEGTCGHAEGAVHVISSPEEVAILQVNDPEKVGYVTQTTLSIDDTEKILAAVRQRFPITGKYDSTTNICFATTNRQRAVRELANITDVLLVVGSKNSSNSNRLREVATNQGIPAYLIDDASEIDLNWLRTVERIGLTAGASAPEHLVQAVVSRLQQELQDTMIVTEMKGQERNIFFQIPEMTI